MRTTTFTNLDDEVVAVPAADRVAAAAGVTGPGFGPATKSGTVASATEQVALARRGQYAGIRSILGDDEARAEREAIVVAVIDRVLTGNGFAAAWYAVVDGIAERLAPASTEARETIAAATDIECELTFTGSDEDLLAAAATVLDTMRELSGSFDGTELAGVAADFDRTILTSRAAAVSIKPSTGELGRLRREAQARIERKAKSETSIFQIEATDLTICPVCQVATDRTDETCTNGHLSARTIRANQEAAICTIVRQVATKAAAGLSVAFEAKVKNIGRVPLSSNPDDLAELVGLLADASLVTVKVNAADVEPYAALAATTRMRDGLAAAYDAFGATDVAARSRVARATEAALDKAADTAAEAIGFTVALEMSRRIDQIRQARFDAATAECDEAARKAAKAPTGKDLKRFADGVNARGTLRDPNARPGRPAGKRSTNRGAKRVNPRNQRRNTQQTGSGRPR